MSRPRSPLPPTSSAGDEPKQAGATAREPLRVLFVEDRPSDVELSLMELRRSGFDVTADVVETREEFVARLRAGRYQVVLSDYGLPGWSGLDALEEMRRLGYDLPFILVTGSLGDEAAVDCVKRGAVDYVIKDRLARLPVAVRQALARERMRQSEAAALRALEASEERYRGLVEHSPDAILLVREGKWTFANQAALSLFGAAAREDLIGRDFLASAEPADRESLRADFAHAVETGTPNPPRERKLVRLDGSLLDVECVAIPFAEGMAAGAQVVIRDVSSRKRMEEALQEREERFRQITENMREAFYMVKADLSELLYVSPAYEVIVGRPRDAVYRDLRVFFSAIHPDDLAAVTSDIGAARRGAEQEAREFRVVRPDGEVRWVLGRTVAVRNSSGEIYRLAGVALDITDRKGEQEALRRSEAEHRGLIEHAPLGIYRCTAAGRFVSVNPALVRILGYSGAEEVLALDVVRDVYADPEERVRLLAQCEDEDQASAEVRWKHRDGSPIIVHLTLSRVRDSADGTVFDEGLVEDVTERRSLENQFRQAQRLEAVGRLAGGVAHDFNNVLTAISGYSDLLLEDMSPQDPKRADLLEIRAAAQRAAALTRQLLAFSRKQVLQTRVLDLNEVVRALERMLQRLIGEDVKLECALAGGLGAIQADPGQLEQVILNLAVNSRDAMPGGGRITIETTNVELGDDYVRTHTGAAAGRYVMLAVSDTGTGMDAETQSHMFEPFFTTKEQGKGTGLGLATVYGIVKQSGGHVWVYSEPGRGTTFKIYLPQVDGPVQAVDLPAATGPVAGGRETILVAEDDSAVREIVTEVLAQKGYHVLRAPEGQTALEIARAHEGAIQMLVTDLVMPGMTGRDLAEALQAARPAIRILYMSGYTDDAVVRHGVLAEGMPYLQKPFTPSALAAKVRETLDRPAEAPVGA